MGLLPIVGADVAPTNAKYAALAAAQGALFVDCTAGMDPTDFTLYEDGIHPTAVGQEKVVACLRPAVAPLLAA
jgi:lysophospholipase L1-like esterase